MAAPVTVYSRIKASAPAGLYSGNISHESTAAVSKLVSVTGTALSLQPTTVSTALTFNSVTSTTFTMNWTSGNGANNLVVLRESGAVNSAPLDGASYNAGVFGSGSELGTGNFVVFAGSGNTVTVSGLQPNTTYHGAVYSFNGSAGTENYITTTPATGNRTTLNAPTGWQIYSVNNTNTINFDTTVDGVNQGAFQGEGMSPTLTIGELNSNAWAVAGFSDGAIAYGGVSSEELDHDRGTSEGNVSVGGLYAFETAADNYALGIQPATGDFVPGSISLRFQNETGAAITSISLGYKVKVYNDQPASSSFNFSHSSDNTTFTTIPGLNVTSPADADAMGGWKSYYRVVTITGLNISNNAYYHLRWTGATVSGSTNFDEFALDDIVLIANPTTNFAAFSGTSESFVVQGNTSLSGDLAVNGNLTLTSGKVTINSNTLNIGGTVTNNIAGALKGSASSNITVSGAQNVTLSLDQTTPGTTCIE